jgi:NADP-dependent 3-hydroxy acid dehydrogenase YdfG
MTTTSSLGTAIVTGASSGIGAATATRLAQEGFDVVAGARRTDRLDDLVAREPSIRTGRLDVTSDNSVAAFEREIAGPVRVLVNNAGVSLGADLVGASDVANWRQMYEVNVLGTLRMIKAFLPRLEASGAGHVVVVGSTVGHVPYETGAGYAATKHALSALAGTLRLELCGLPIRVSEIAPGMVRTEEFLLHRFGEDTKRIEKIYEGVSAPLTAEDIADCIAFAVTRPPHVDVDFMIVRPVAQAAQHKVHRVLAPTGIAEPR